MGERLKPAVLKTVIPRERDRGFESLSLRQKIWSFYFKDLGAYPSGSLELAAKGFFQQS